MRLHYSIANFDTEKFSDHKTMPKQRGGSMKDVTVRQLEMANRVVGFFRENPIAFRRNSPGADLVEQLSKQVGEIQSLTATQAAQIGLSRAQSQKRGAARESLNTTVMKISHTADAIAISRPEIAARVHGGRRMGDSKLETRARALAESAKPYVKDFVNFEMDPKFIETLEAQIDALTGAIAEHKASRAAHAATSQLIDEAMGRALTTLAQLDPIIENKLAGNTALQLKWENVRRTERRWVYKKPEETSEEPKTDLVPAA